MLPGLRLRQARERLGLTYRDVERASYELAAHRGRTEFILHISRLADIENHGVVPGLYKLYTLAVVYHLHPLEIFRWYEVPLDDTFRDGTAFPAPQTHLMAPPVSCAPSGCLEPGCDPQCTEFLPHLAHRWEPFENMLSSGTSRYRYAYIGLSDLRMAPLLRPGSIVQVDISVRRIEDTQWTTEYDRPMYFVEVRDGYRCGWFHQDGSRLMMQPHPLSRCSPESWRMPEEAELVGLVVGMVTRLNEPWNNLSGEPRATRADSNRRAL